MGVDEIRDGLYISNADHVIDTDTEDLPDIVICVCRNEPFYTDDCPVVHQHYPLWDSDVDQQAMFNQAVMATIKAIETHEECVLVHCIAGVSRSPAVVATALAWIDDVHFDEARDEIWRQRPQIAIHPALREHGLDYLDQDYVPFEDS